MHPMLNIATRAARAAGNIIARNLGRIDPTSIVEKNKDDLVTNIDRECENLIVSSLLKSYRDHCVIGEETGINGNKDSEYQWIIDPIDGTTNFIQGIGHVAVSIALKHKGITILGVVFDPIKNEMFTASRGDGASLNGRRIRVANKSSLNGSIIATAFPVRYRERMGAYMNVFNKLIDNCADIRRMGAASLDLAYVACGRVDGYLEQGLKIWDFAAGELLVREAGGIITDFQGQVNYTKSGNILCANAYIVKDLLKTIDSVNINPILI